MTEPRMLGGSSVTRLISSTSIFIDSRRYWARFRAETPGPPCACAPIDGNGIELTVSTGREVEQTQSVCAVVQHVAPKAGPLGFLCPWILTRAQSHTCIHQRAHVPHSAQAAAAAVVAFARARGHRSHPRQTRTGSRHPGAGRRQ
jgi:hypothetical protein